MIKSEEVRNDLDWANINENLKDFLLDYITQQEKVNELFMISDEIIYIYELPSINIRNTRRLNELKIKLRKIKGELERELK